MRMMKRALSNTGKKYRAGMFVPALFTERIYTPKMVLWKPTLPRLREARKSKSDDAPALKPSRPDQHFIDERNP
jgi:hypothetical protein